uniref:Uncharacterized protein n=1 Tax=Anopheles culicifacies TaxID=139723 RepID=A0A182M162_9DIPT
MKLLAKRTESSPKCGRVKTILGSCCRNEKLCILSERQVKKYFELLDMDHEICEEEDPGDDFESDVEDYYNDPENPEELFYVQSLRRITHQYTNTTERLGGRVDNDAGLRSGRTELRIPFGQFSCMQE